MNKKEALEKLIDLTHELDMAQGRVRHYKQQLAEAVTDEGKCKTALIAFVAEFNFQAEERLRTEFNLGSGFNEAFLERLHQETLPDSFRTGDLGISIEWDVEPTIEAVAIPESLHQLKYREERKEEQQEDSAVAVAGHTVDSVINMPDQEKATTQEPLQATGTE